MTLKTREIQFEDRVGDEHFEDVLIDKRLWMVGPKAFCQFGTDWEVPARKWISMLRYTVKPQLAEFRKQLRDRFDYRLIVDWVSISWWFPCLPSLLTSSSTGLWPFVEETVHAFRPEEPRRERRNPAILQLRNNTQQACIRPLCNLPTRFA